MWDNMMLPTYVLSLSVKSRCKTPKMAKQTSLKKRNDENLKNNCIAIMHCNLIVSKTDLGCRSFYN
jgi:hypothetical protein